MYIYDIITETFVEFYYRDLNTPNVSYFATAYINSSQKVRTFSGKRGQSSESSVILNSDMIKGNESDVANNDFELLA